MILFLVFHKREMAAPVEEAVKQAFYRQGTSQPPQGWSTYLVSSPCHWWKCRLCRDGYSLPPQAGRKDGHSANLWPHLLTQLHRAPTTCLPPRKEPRNELMLLLGHACPMHAHPVLCFLRGQGGRVEHLEFKQS